MLLFYHRYVGQLKPYFTKYLNYAFSLFLQISENMHFLASGILGSEKKIHLSVFIKYDHFNFRKLLYTYCIILGGNFNLALLTRWQYMYLILREGAYKIYSKCLSANGFLPRPYCPASQE